MNKISITLKVFFEDPFWVGILERVEDQQLSVCKITFGSEPKDNEIYDFLLKKYRQLQFSPSISTVEKKSHVSYKRQLRESKKALLNVGIGTKSQQALQLQYEQNKMISKKNHTQLKHAKKQQQFEMKQQKRKEKHKGR